MNTISFPITLGHFPMLWRGARVTHY